MDLRRALTNAVERLTANRVPSPRMNAELLLRFVLSCDRAYLFAHPERELTEEEASRYEETLARRSTGVPAQYITGHQEFWGLDLIVSPAVLIPRPETEHVVEKVLELVQSTLEVSQRNLRLVDVGTGSGAIALALARELPSAEIHATDISREALEIAQANAARLELASRIQFHQTDLLAALPRASFDVVVSNPPYVGESEAEEVQLEVRKFEPKAAVFAGPRGLEIIERLIPQASEHLLIGGWLVFEISGAIAKHVPSLLTGWLDIEMAHDLQGIARVLSARKIR